MKKIIVSVVLSAALVIGATQAAQAFSVSELQAQIQSLLAMVASLQQQIAAQTDSSVSTGGSSTATMPWWCSSFVDVGYGARGARVQALQEAMGSQVLGYQPTGYYGTLTHNAWQRWCGGTPIVGGDRDAYGCIPSAGYTWCSALNQCIRPWETTCPVVTTVDPSTNPQCKTWDDGCNICSREFPGGGGMCTLRACLWQNQAQARCTSYFDGTGTNRAPVISGFSGPTTLAVKQTGTWTVQASDPENGQLSYSVDWGDQPIYAYDVSAANIQRAFTQTTTFTHSYASLGTYTVAVTVRDAQGQTAQTTTTVRVGSAPIACTMEYAPVCGQPPYVCTEFSACRTVMPQPRTYSNTCVMNAAGATFLYSGVCSNMVY